MWRSFWISYLLGVNGQKDQLKACRKTGAKKQEIKQARLDKFCKSKRKQDVKKRRPEGKVLTMGLCYVTWRGYRRHSRIHFLFIYRATEKTMLQVDMGRWIAVESEEQQLYSWPLMAFPLCRKGPRLFPILVHNVLSRS